MSAQVPPPLPSRAAIPRANQKIHQQPRLTGSSPSPRNTATIPPSQQQRQNAEANRRASATQQQLSALSRQVNDPRTEQYQASYRRPTSPEAPANEISRERYILTGGETGPSIVPSIPIRQTNQKPRPRTRTAAWEFATFSNQARSDNLQLKHWQRVGTPKEYPFARFNKPVNLITYTNEEYSIVIEQNVKPSHGIRMQSAITNSQQQQQQQQVQNQHKHSKNKNSHLNNMPTNSVSSPYYNNNNDTNKNNMHNQNTNLSGANTRRATAAAAAASSTSTTINNNRGGNIPTFNTSSIGSTGGSLRHGIDQVPPCKPWTKEETDELFQLCKQFDLRFPVIYDRWPTSKFEDRSIDELKDRYYSVAKLIIDHRQRTNPESINSLSTSIQKHCQAIIMNPFDYEYECIRKNQLEYQYYRSKAELREEEETVREARRIEANRRRNLKERQRLVKLLAPTVTSISQHPNTNSNSLNSNHPNQSSPDAMAAIAASSILAPQKTFPHRKISTGPFARSSLVFAPVSQSSKVCKRVDAGLDELKVSLRPMPTCTVVDNFDLLRIDILNILELNRTVAKKEEEIYSLRVKLAKAKGDPIPPPPPGVPSSHKKRRLDDAEVGPIFGGRV